MVGLTSLLLVQVSALSGLGVRVRRSGLLYEVLCRGTRSAVVRSLLLSGGAIAHCCLIVVSEAARGVAVSSCSVGSGVVVVVM